ncbi:hypothetical protein AJ80_08950 [Polytolypa hystricis UAMH7299]|uniref:Uncharacterized protein n=1 Tax=Polytolypa hystricis (strain UAMH7299) TaxID=1447883 RepID=A0A2B7WZP0_POLH7|nr:hypothetical protein AJ80_08950 [Polytolypa hystricis UAMH7299]
MPDNETLFNEDVDFRKPKAMYQWQRAKMEELRFVPVLDSIPISCLTNPSCSAPSTFHVTNDKGTMLNQETNNMFMSRTGSFHNWPVGGHIWPLLPREWICTERRMRTAFSEPRTAANNDMHEVRSIVAVFTEAPILRIMEIESSAPSSQAFRSAQDSIQRQSLACESRGLPFEFDPEAVCGITLTTSTISESTTTGDSESSTASSTVTSEESSTVTSEALSTDSQTISSESTPTPIANSALGKRVMLKAIVVLVAASQILY